MKKKDFPVNCKFNMLTILREVAPQTTIRRTGTVKNTRCIEVRCDCGVVKIIQANAVISGRIKSCGCYKKQIAHDNKSLIHSIGINDYNGRVYTKGKMIKSYQKWHQMIDRCYNPKALTRRQSYIGCSVCDEWKYFTNFKKWFDDNYIEGYQLDKDILVKGNKVYSPKTCCFVPHEINSLFIYTKKNKGKFPLGVYFHKSKQKYIAQVSQIRNNIRSSKYSSHNNIMDAYNSYKQMKESYIKEVANEWKDRIAPNVYKAMCNYKVEITD